MMISKAPEWVTELKVGNELVVCFKNTGLTVFAEVVENYPYNDFIQFGTLTICYELNNVAHLEDLLYDDYNAPPDNVSSWTAYHVT